MIDPQATTQVVSGSVGHVEMPYVRLIGRAAVAGAKPFGDGIFPVAG